MREFLVISGLYGRLQFVQAAGDDQVGDGLQELVGCVAVVGAVVRQPAVARGESPCREAYVSVF